MDAIFIFVWIMMGVWCYSIAKRQGRNTTLGFVMGALFGFVAVIVYACIGKTKELKKEELDEAVDERIKAKNENSQN